MEHSSKNRKINLDSILFNDSLDIERKDKSGTVLRP